MKILFIGTPDFARESLDALYNSEHEIIGVVTNPDKPKGRGMKLAYSEVKEYALNKNIKIFQPQKIRNNPEFIKEIKELNPDIICVVVYGKFLPKELLEIPKYGCINVHPSLLPKYRGAAPIQWAIINGDEKTGVCTMYLNEEMDAGDVILCEETVIGENDTTGDLWYRLSNIGAKLLVKTVDMISNGTAPRTPQIGEPLLAPMLDKEISKINWNKTSKEIKNLTRALNPIMGTCSVYNGKKLKFWKMENEIYDDIAEKYEEYENSVPGTVIYSDEKLGLYIKTGDGIIKVIEIQAENSKKMDIYSFLRGNKIAVGDVLE